MFFKKKHKGAHFASNQPKAPKNNKQETLKEDVVQAEQDSPAEEVVATTETVVVDAVEADEALASAEDAVDVTVEQAAPVVTEDAPSEPAAEEDSAQESVGISDTLLNQDLANTTVSTTGAETTVEDELDTVEATTVAAVPDIEPLETLTEDSVTTTPEDDIYSLPVIQANDDEKREAKRRRRRRSLIALLVTLLVIGTVYLGGVYAFTRYFMPNTTLNGDDVSLASAEDVASRIGSQTEEYTLSVTGDNLDLTIASADIDLRSDGDTFVSKAFDQVNPWEWPLTVFSPHRLEVEDASSFDDKKLSALVEAAVKKQNDAAEKPVDAKATYNAETHLYVIEPEKQGNAVDVKLALERIKDSLERLDDTVELGEDELLKPAITADNQDLKKQVDAINERLGATQKLKIGDNEVFEVTGDLIANWVKVGDDLKITVNKGAITEWAQGDLSRKLDSAGSDRSFTRPDGKQINVSGGDYGWSIDGATLAETIAGNIENGTQATIDVPMLSEGATWNPGGQDWGNRYIDIDISEQHVRMYDESSSLIWESDCVTGNSSEGHDTPTGVYELNGNKTMGEVRLEGPIDPSTNEPEYVSYVTYWMPFIWDAVALHDATWRYSFGGDIYQYDGSHGCVNLPYDAAESLYGITQVGDVVVVHY